MRTARGLFRIGVLFVALAASAAPAEAQNDAYKSRHHGYYVETLFEDLNSPWALAFLPDGRMLVTEQAGQLNLLDPANGSRARIEGVPKVAAVGQGGLLDVVLHPEFPANRLVYLTYTVTGEGGYATQVGRGRLEDHEFRDFEVLFTATPFSPEEMQFGSRLAFDRNGYLFVTLGERTDRNRAQLRDGYRGSVVRLTDDGAVPPDNPFRGDGASLPGIWTYGHRNPQGLAVHPATGEVWLSEHGPRGGDALNILKAGSNYGWPKVTFGREYSGEPIGVQPPVPGFEPPVHHWSPSIAPSGMAFYQGDAFEHWRGDLFIAALVQRKLVRLRLHDGQVVEEEDLMRELGWRIRDVKVGADGYLYVLPDDWGAPLMRLRPTSE